MYVRTTQGDNTSAEHSTEDTIHTAGTGVYSETIDEKT